MSLAEGRGEASGSASRPLDLPLLSLPIDAGETSLLDLFERFGAFQAVLPEECAARTRQVFELALRFLALPDASKRAFALDPSSSSPPNGYHGPGGLGGYNKHRSGFIFQGTTVWPLLGDEEGDFVEALAAWREGVWGVAGELLEKLASELRERRLLRDDLATPGLLSQGGARDMLTHSQLHVKRTHEPEDSSAAGCAVLLPAHRDPSLFSIVIHLQEDPPGQGLELLDDSSGEYRPVPRSGCHVATVIAGRLLPQLCECAAFRPARAVHRVSASPGDLGPRRLAATFFFQPAPDAPLEPLVREPSRAQGSSCSYGQAQKRSYARYRKAEPKGDPSAAGA